MTAGQLRRRVKLGYLIEDGVLYFKWIDLDAWLDVVKAPELRDQLAALAAELQEADRG